MNLEAKNFPMEGGCDCGKVRYRLESKPLFVHCCHCRWCQRESGTAFALNAMIESDRVTTLGTEPIKVEVPSESGDGQTIHRCPHCQVAVWSNYGDPQDFVRLVRVGTLDKPDLCPPSVQIYIESKQPWVTLSQEIPAFEKTYSASKDWPPDSLERRPALHEKRRAHEKKVAEAGGKA